MKLGEVRSGLLGKAGVNVRVNLRDAPRRVHRDERRLMIFQFGKGRHCSTGYTNGSFRFSTVYVGGVALAKYAIRLGSP